MAQQLSRKTQVIGLTGGIGSGKTSASKCFADLAVPVFNADLLAREVIAPGTPANLELQQVLAPIYFTTDGILDRQQLRRDIFDNPKLLSLVESIVHPAVKSALGNLVNAATAEGNDYIVIEISLLFESGMDTMVDKTLVIDCPEELQIKRASSRDAQSPIDIKKIIKQQTSRENRLKKANYSVDNSSSFESLTSAIKRLHRVLLESSSR